MVTLLGVDVLGVVPIGFVCFLCCVGCLFYVFVYLLNVGAVGWWELYAGCCCCCDNLIPSIISPSVMSLLIMTVLSLYVNGLNM